MSLPLTHRHDVYSARFSPDGRRLVTASLDHTARVWQIMLDDGSEPSVARLADLAEVLGGYRVTDQGTVVPLKAHERRERILRLVGRDSPPALTFRDVVSAVFLHMKPSVSVDADIEAAPVPSASVRVKKPGADPLIP